MASRYLVAWGAPTTLPSRSSGLPMAVLSARVTIPVVPYAVGTGRRADAEGAQGEEDREGRGGRVMDSGGHRVAPFWVGRPVGSLLYQGGPGSATRDGAGEPDPTRRGARVARPPRRIGASR